MKDLVEQVEAKPAEIRALFNNTIDPASATDVAVLSRAKICWVVSRLGNL